MDSNKPQETSDAQSSTTPPQETLHSEGYSPRLIDDRISHIMCAESVVALVGPDDAGKASTALAHAASADLLDANDPPLDAAAGRTPKASLAPSENIRRGPTLLANISVDPTLVLHGAEPHAVTDLQAAPVAAPTIVAYAKTIAQPQVDGVPPTSAQPASATHNEKSPAPQGVLIITTSVDADESLMKAAEERRAMNQRVQLPVALADAQTTPQVPTPVPTYLRMLPMTLQELGLSTGTVSLDGLFRGVMEPSKFHPDMPPAPHPATTADIARACCLGGWPALRNLPQGEALEQVSALVSTHIDQVTRVAKMDPAVSRALAWSLAGSLGEVPTYAHLINGIEAATGSRPARDTVRTYLHELERCQLTLPILGWNPPDRARVRIRTKPKHYFVDPSIPAALLGLTPGELTMNPIRLTTLLQNLLARDLHVYLEATGGGRVCHYLDDSHIAVNFVVERPDGSWGAIQVALSEATTERQIRHLGTLAKKLRDCPPAFRALVTGQGSFAYQRDDGIFVVPITLLGA